MSEKVIYGTIDLSNKTATYAVTPESSDEENGLEKLCAENIGKRVRMTIEVLE